MRNRKFLNQSTNLRRSAVSRACLTFAVALASAPGVFAGAGFGDSVGPDGITPIRVPTFYAHSPSGPRDVVPPEVAATYNNTIGTGTALRKFVDNLAPLGLGDGTNGYGNGLNNTLSDNVTKKYIPVAAATPWIRPDGSTSGDDYYEIAVIEYTEKMHSDLKKPTTLRGYVQLTKSADGKPLFYLKADGTQNPDAPIMIQDTDASQNRLVDGAGAPIMVQAKSLDNPHYLGPAIVATKGKPTRIKFVNLLPVGRFDGTKRNGDLFIPVDETLPGAGVGSDGLTRFTQNRANIHLHGGDNPWISDGTPHQWITPAGEADPTVTGSLANATSNVAADVLPTFLRGPSTNNVPDMPDPGPGANTYYFPNGQSGRLEWYHDHAFGLTRLNAYSGMAAPYVLTDPAQDTLLANVIAGNGVPGVLDTIPLVIQDKAFVPDDIALQDAKWNKDIHGAATPAWGTPGDLWYPHVYEVNQDPNNGADGTNPVGRWDWGPYFWPVFPALYNVPGGAVGDVTLTPEAWMDTPVVNGVGYPKLAVEPKTYRFRILNGANDRFWNLSLFVADSAVSSIQVTGGGSGYVTPPVVNFGGPGTGATATAVLTNGVVTSIVLTNPGTGYTTAPLITFTGTSTTPAAATATVAVNTEVKMVPAVPQAAQALPACAVDAKTGVETWPAATTTNPIACLPSTWPKDGRIGGVPDPATAGPSFFQIGSEGGLLPGVAEIKPHPMAYEYNRRSITVLNAETFGLFMANAERADVLVDFSGYAGKSLIMYSDAPAPVPAFDPRNDHWTGKPDETGVGSVETPHAGYGPNTRTVMRFDVAPLTTTPNDTLIPAVVTALPGIYAATQDRPIVGQSAYNAAVSPPATWSDSPQADGTKAFSTIFVGTLQEPTFKFNPGTPGNFTSINLLTGGGGYLTPPVVTVAAPASGVQATATATLRISDVQVTNPGSGYRIAPLVRFANTGAGNGASATASLMVVDATVTPGFAGTGYSAATPPALTFSAPTSPTMANGGLRATATARVNASGGIIGIVLTPSVDVKGSNKDANGNFYPVGGFGYAGAPTITVAPPVSGVTAKLVSVAGVGRVTLTAANPQKPNLVGGGAYTDMGTVTVGFGLPPAGGTTPTATVTGSVFDVTLVKPGSGYTGTPAVTIAAPPSGFNSLGVANTTATAQSVAGGSMLVKNKAIQELFDPTYGRMNATLGIELPFTSALTQTTIPLGYVDPVSEIIDDGETQIWKITHNGVDSHPVHFHLYNVQVVNRIGWDGTVKPPRANELGWKETIMMNPLEDIMVTMKAKKPYLPGFGLPLSSRPRDPSQPLGTPTGFTQIDPLTGNPATVVNQMDDYGWEYVWHCHILGHEENDFMRPVKFNANELPPAQPTMVGAAIVDATAKLYWIDTSATEYQYLVKRAPVINGNTPSAGSYATISTLLANSSSFTDTPPAKTGNVTNYSYKVTAVGAAGSVDSSAAQMSNPWPENVALVVGAPSRITWAAPIGGPAPTNYLVESSQNGTTWKTVGTTVANSGTLSMNLPGSNALTAGTFASYQFRVTAQSIAGGVTTKSQPTTLIASINAPTAVTATVTGNIAVISWTPSPSAPVGTTNLVQYRSSVNSVNSGAPYSSWLTVANPNRFTLTSGRSYQFRVTSSVVVVAGTTLSATSGSSTPLAFFPPAVPTNLRLVKAEVGTGTNNATLAQDLVTIGWDAPTLVAGQIPPTTYTLWFGNTPTTGGIQVTVPGDATTFQYALANTTKVWYVRIRAQNGAGNSTTTNRVAITIP